MKWIDSHEWVNINGIRVVCPYCDFSELYLGESGRIGFIVTCKNCGEKFKLGEQN